MDDFKELQNDLVAGMGKEVKELIGRLIKQGMPPQDIISKGLLSGMGEVGKRFKEGDMFIPEVILSAKIMSESMAVLEPLLLGDPLPISGKVVMGTVEGDVHNIGKDLISMMLRSVGFAVVDVGVQVPAERFVQAVLEHKPEVLGMSALLTTTMPRMREVILLLEEKGLRDRIRIMVGGAPVTQDFADEIGADGYAPDAGLAMEKVKEFTGLG
jgi:5-methyltetrahydrofolate--homocysteine methyltransferase